MKAFLATLTGCLLFFASLSGSAFAQSPRQLVIAGSQGDGPQIADPLVVRQRGVSLNLSALTLAAGDPSRSLQIAFFDDAVVTMEITGSEATYSGGTAYRGHVVTMPMSPVVIVDNNGVVSIIAMVGDRRFSLQGSSGTGYVAREMADHNRPDHPTTGLDLTGGARFNVPGASQADPIFSPPPTAARDDGSTMDVMVVYTPAARTANSGTAQMHANIDTQIALTNTIYANSNVVQRLRLVYRGETNYTEVNMDTDLPRVTTSGDGHMDDVPLLRDLYKADFVSLWGVYNDYCGLGWLMATENASFASLGYNVTASPSCTGAGSYTFAHELGHNMGLRHDNYMDSAATTVTPEAGGAAVSVGYAHGYIDLTNRFRTVMSYNDQCVASGFNCSRIPHFSNPSISYNNSGFYGSAVLATTGNASNAHERQALNDTRETTSNFRTALLSFTGPGIVAFLPAAYTVAEGGGSVTLTVGRHVGSTGAISVAYSTANGSATAGADYTTTSGTLNWADGDSANKTIVVPILQDVVLEGNHAFTVTMNSPTGGASVGASGGTSTSATVTITDDEPDTFPVGGSIPAGYVTPGTSPGAWAVDLTQGYLSTASLRSAQVYGDMTNYTNSDLEYTATFPAGNVTFAYKVSSYPNYGRFDFQIDGVTVLTNAGGEVDWTPVTQAVTAGTHTLRWRFRNRLSFACANANPAPPGGANCADRAWVDSIVLPGAVSSTSTSLGTSANPSTVGQSVTFTATVTSGGGTPAGNVNFKDGASSISGCASVALSAGSAQCVTSSLTQGVHSITAEYAGNASFSASTSGALSQTVNAAVSKRFDFNADGRADILLRNLTTGENYLYPMNGTSVLGTEGYIRTVNSPWALAGIGDFDGNGTADLLWRNSSNGDNYIYFMNGTTIASEGYIRTVPLAWSVAGIADLDGDGKADILLRNLSTGENYLYPMDGLNIKGTEGYIRTVASPWTVAGLADFNGDGRADILLRNTTTGENYLYPMNGTSILGTEGYIRTVPLAWDIAGLGDFDGDGKADILLRNSGNGDNYLYPMDGTSIKGTEGYIRTVPLVWAVASIADLDGDGKVDILLRNTSTGENYLYPMDGTTIKGTEGYIRTVPLAWSVVSK
jgi:hypothetical protein